MTMTARDEYPSFLTTGSQEEYFNAFWDWREKYPFTCEECFRQNLEVFCCPSDDYTCLYCCEGSCGEHESYTYEETEESEM